MEVPKYLFRYRDNSTDHFWDDLEKAIVSRRFYLGRASDQNDPFEAKPNIAEANISQIEVELKKRFGSNPILDRQMVEKKEGRRVSRQEFRRRFKEFRSCEKTARMYVESVNNMLNELPKRTGLASFSKVADSVLMWGLYANSHRGVVLCFEQHLDSHQEGDLLPVEVKYQGARPVLSAEDYVRVGGGNLADAEEMARKTFATKSSVWRHEKEWRLFDVSGKNRSYVSASSLKPVGLIFGCNTPADVIEKAVQRFSGYIPFYKCETSNNSFELKHREFIEKSPNP